MSRRISTHCLRGFVFFVFVTSVQRALAQDVNHRRDPTPVIYPGQVNIGLLASIHEPPPANSSNGCGKLRQDIVQSVMASVWTAHQANFKKEDPNELNIGVYIYDTCGREDVAQRQIYRLLGHVGHVQTTTCSEKRIPPLFAVITEGDPSTLRTPVQLLESFGVPVISSAGPPMSGRGANPDVYLSTAPTASALARAAVTVLRQLRLLEVAVIAEDKPPTILFEEFSQEAHISGMQALPVDHPSVVGDPDNFLASLQVVSEYGRSRLKAVVFLVSTTQAIDLLQSVDSSNFPQMPWVIVTEKDLAPTILTTFKRHQLRRLQQVLLLSPESTDMPEFQEYFRQLLQEDTIKYHPLLMEFAESVAGENKGEERADFWRNAATHVPDGVRSSSSKPTGSIDSTDKPKMMNASPTTYQEADVSSMVKAVWTLAASLKTIQKRSCRRGTDCLLYLRRSLSSYVLKAARSLNYTLDITSGAASLRDTNLSFGEDGTLNSVRFSLKGFTHRGDIQEVGWYSDESGLTVDHSVALPFNGFVFKSVDPPSIDPTSSTPEIHSKYRLYSNKPSPLFATTTTFGTTVKTAATTAPVTEVSETTEDTSSTSAAQPLEKRNPNRSPLEEDYYTSWKIFDDVGLAQNHFTTPHESHTNKTPIPLIPDSYEDPLLQPPDGISTNQNHVFGSPVQVRPRLDLNLTYSVKPTESGVDAAQGAPFSSDQSSSSNLRSISLTSHHEPRINDPFLKPKQDSLLPTALEASRPAMARSIDRTSAGVIPPMASEDIKVVSSNRNLHISAWLARPWALTVLGVCGFGILVTMYVLVFLMVKSCEGSLKKTNTAVAVAQLLSLISMYVAAGLFTWKPSSLLCGLQRLIPNVSYAFCFGCLLLKAMHLRAQNNLGLGGSVNRFNQLLTLLFIVGVQVALEIQWWFVRPPGIVFRTLECITTKEEIMESQGYISFLLILGVVLALSTRKIPYNCQEVRSLMATTLTCLIVFLAWDAACWLLPDSSSRNIAAPSALIVTAIVVLTGIFGPQLFAIHKYGGFPHKPLSYADSLSTVFTMFKDLDNNSNSGTTGRGKKTAKTLETPFGNEVGEGTRNPLYNDFQSAYP